jgi:hypothetical protein
MLLIDCAVIEHNFHGAALVSTSCKALCHLSYVWPGAVLPLVLGRFQAALQTATAMHQVRAESQSPGRYPAW